jgi:hypothetical protein
MWMSSHFLIHSVGACLTVAALYVGPAAAAPPSATFSAWEHRFDGPDRLPAGQTTIRLQNRRSPINYRALSWRKADLRPIWLLP